MSLESHAASLEDRLLDGLNFAPGRPTASYVTSSTMASFPAASGDRFGPSGIKFMRFNVADATGFLDGQSVRLIFDIQTTDGATLVPGCISPASLFTRLRITSNGSAEVENLENYGRVYEMFSKLLPSSRRYNDITEGWGGIGGFLGNALAGPPDGSNTSNAEVAQETLALPAQYLPIDGNGRRVCVQLYSGPLNQQKMIPLSMMPLTVELTLDDKGDCWKGDSASTQNSWYIQNVRLVANVLQLDQQLANYYAKHVLDGGTIPITFSSTYSMLQTVGGRSDVALTFARGFTRLSTIFWNFTRVKDNGQRAYSKHYYLWHPLDGATPNLANDTVRVNFQVGALRFPTFDMDSVQESWYRLRQANLVHHGSDSFSISSYQYRGGSSLYQDPGFVGALDLEKAPGQAAHSGVNTRNGQLGVLNLSGLGSGVQEVHIICVNDTVVRISAAGVEVMD